KVDSLGDDKMRMSVGRFNVLAGRPGRASPQQRPRHRVAASPQQPFKAPWPGSKAKPRPPHAHVVRSKAGQKPKLVDITLVGDLFYSVPGVTYGWLCDPGPSTPLPPPSNRGASLAFALSPHS